MPLTIYRRHSSDCSHKSKGRPWHRCDCPIWVQGSLGGEYVRESLNLTVWGAAQERVRGWEASGHRKTLRAVGQGPTGTARAIDTACVARLVCMPDRRRRVLTLIGASWKTPSWPSSLR